MPKQRSDEKLIGLGLDLSLTGTGLVVFNGQRVLRYGCLETEPMPKAVKDRTTGLRVRRDGSSVFRGASREERIEWVRRKVASTVRHFPIGLACVEGYSFASKGSSMTDLAELRGVILNVLFRNDVQVDIIAPPTLKKLATGDGRADKDEMVRKARRKWKRCPDNDNVADGFHLAVIAQERYEASCSF